MCGSVGGCNCRDFINVVDRRNRGVCVRTVVVLSMGNQGTGRMVGLCKNVCLELFIM